jgi:asparagine synthase (glutamine-hydrolysing)
MAVSLEGRLPLLSRKIIEFVFSLPENIRYHKGELKGLLKEAYKDILPKENIQRRKMGFAIPFQYFDKNNKGIQETILKRVFEIH